MNSRGRLESFDATARMPLDVSLNSTERTSFSWTSRTRMDCRETAPVRHG